MIKHTNIKHKKKESLKNLFSKLSYSQTSDSHKFQIIQNLNYSNLKTTGTNRKFVIFCTESKNIHKETLNTAKNNSKINKTKTNKAKINKVKKIKKIKKPAYWWAKAACIRLATQPFVGPGCRPAKAQ